MSKQVPTSFTTVDEIMRRPTFALGVSDARAGRPVRRDYDLWDIDDQWDYERGRQWATIAPRNIPLKHNGRINPDAVAWFRRHGDDII
jgi:hypothetical protein